MNDDRADGRCERHKQWTKYLDVPRHDLVRCEPHDGAVRAFLVGSSVRPSRRYDKGKRKQGFRVDRDPGKVWRPSSSPSDADGTGIAVALGGRPALDDGVSSRVPPRSSPDQLEAQRAPPLTASPSFSARRRCVAAWARAAFPFGGDGFAWTSRFASRAPFGTRHNLMLDGRRRGRREAEEGCGGHCVERKDWQGRALWPHVAMPKLRSETASSGFSFSSPQHAS